MYYYPVHHLDAVDDGADGEAERTAGAGVDLDGGDVRLGVELDGLVAGVVAGHVALAAVYAHLGVNQGHHVLSVVQVERSISYHGHQRCDK